MPWSNQGGGPWGPRGGNNGGWNRGGSSGPPPGPDLEEILRRGQDRVRQALPGNFGGKGILLGVFVLLAIWLGSGFYTIEPDEQGLVLRFGNYYKTTLPGLNYHWPYPIETVEKVNVSQVRRVEIGLRSGDGVRNLSRAVLEGESLMLTGDENIIDIGFVVQWAVADAEAFAFNVRNPDVTVKDAAESAMREVIGKTEIESALAEGRAEVAAQTLALLQQILDDYQSGIVVTELLLQAADPPQTVIDDYRDVQDARTDRQRLINQAEAYKNRVGPEARGQAEQIRQDAAAYKEQVIAQATGAAQRFISVYDQYRLAEDVTRQRIYIETMESVLSGMTKVIIDQNSESTGVVPYLPLPEIQSRIGQGLPRGDGQ